MKGMVPVLYNQVTSDAAKDEADVLAQVSAVSKALKELGFDTVNLPFSEKIDETVKTLIRLKPCLVFNLTESVAQKGKLSYVAPSILEVMGIPYTGCPAEAILLTTNKVVAKKLLKSSRIPTPEWLTLQEDAGFVKGKRYIIKPMDEDGSVHITNDSVITGEAMECVLEQIRNITEKTEKAFFAERYIEGRELNISMIGKGGQPQVLPPIEIKYAGFRENNRPEILDYKAKWEEESFEFKNTVPSHDFNQQDYELLERLEEYSIKCWHEFGLKGYARVDYRIDQEGNPWVLEINANPCITPGESGFLRSATLAGLSFTRVIERLIDEV